MPFQASPQQAAVIEWVRAGRGSAFIEAVAGAGKTTTLIEALAETTGSVAFAAFNKKIADEIKAKVADRGNPKSKNYDDRFAAMGNRVRIGTFHSFGFGAWRRAYPNVKSGPQAVDEKRRLTDEHLGLVKGNPLAPFVAKLISLAKQRAIGLHGAIADRSLWYDIVDHFDLAYEIEDPALIEQGVEKAIAGLEFHKETAPEVIDFDDMIYMPVVSGIRLWENDWIFVDEAQDTNPARRALARKMLRRNGRAAFVGDRHQAIYGFTGADNDAIDQIVRNFNAQTLPLTITFRCPKTVVALAQTVVSHIQAHETAPDGKVHDMLDEELVKLTDLSPADAILCRKTKPLVEMAYALIRKGVACHVEGKDIGIGLLKLVNRFSVRSIEQLRDRLDAFCEREVEKLVAKGKETQAESLQDRVETIKVLMDGCPDVDCVRRKISTMFLDADSEAKPTLTLSTVHKAKGREWNRVFVLGARQFMPSKWARQQWQLDQEMNLIYVAYTRSKSELVLVDVKVE